MPPRRRVITQGTAGAVSDEPDVVATAADDDAEPEHVALKRKKKKKTTAVRKVVAPKPEPVDDSDDFDTCVDTLAASRSAKRAKTESENASEHVPFGCGECERIYQEQMLIGIPFLPCSCKVCKNPVWFRDGDMHREYRRSTPGYCNGCRTVVCRGPTFCAWAMGGRDPTEIHADGDDAD